MSRLLMALLIASVADSVTEPWKLDDRERAARRADPQLNAIRRAIAISEGKTRANDDSILVDGSRNPELVMPTELVHAIPVAYNPYHASKKLKEKWEARGASQLLGDDWWTRLHDIMREFIETDIEVTRIGVKLQKASGEERNELERKNQALQSGSRLCRMRAESLIVGREAFGREKFDQFLYQVIAPDAFHRSSTSSPESFADTLLWVEGGCR